MDASLGFLRDSLLRRLCTDPGLDLENHPLRKARTVGYLERWLMDMEPSTLKLIRSYLEEVQNPEELRDFLVTAWPSFKMEWDWNFEGQVQDPSGLTLARKLWSGLLERDRVDAIRRASGENFLEFRQELVNRSIKLEDSEKKFRALFGARDLGWDLDSGVWDHQDMNRLWTLAELLGGRKDIQALARLMGRVRRPKEKPQSQRLAEEAVFYDQGEPQPGRTEIHGLKRGASLGESLPQELALLAHKDTSDLFWARWAESSLLGWDYRTRIPSEKVKHSDASSGAQDPGGPLILLFDTSGSMRGKPEEIAKLMALAVVKECSSTGRPVYMINYSLELKALEVTDLAGSLVSFLEFLGFSFYGGTDLNPALGWALNLLRQKEWENADILVISDFSQPKLRPLLVSEVKKIQATLGTKLYCLSVSMKTLKDNLNIFDAGWVYNINPKSAEGIDPSLLKTHLSKSRPGE